MSAEETFDASLRDVGGRLDMAGIPDGTLKTLLLTFRAGFAGALDAAPRPAGLKFYFDFVDSNDVNAFAFYDSEVAYVGVTCGLVSSVLAQAHKHGLSTDLRSVVGLPTTPPAFEIVSIYMALAFVVSHEFGHHAWGHVGPLRPRRFAERDLHRSPGIGAHVDELMADGFAAYLLVETLLTGGFRPLAVQFLEIGDLSREGQDRVLMSTAMATIGGLFGAFLVGPFDAATVRDQSHPPPMTRLAFIMLHLGGWANQTVDQKHLGPWLTGNRYRELMTAAVGHENRAEIQAESDFRKTSDGKRYIDELMLLLKTAQQDSEPWKAYGGPNSPTA